LAEQVYSGAEAAMSERSDGTSDTTRVGPVVLVVSPHAGRGANFETPRRLLEAAGLAVGLEVKVEALDHHTPQGARWRAEGFRAVVAAGGDGTIGAVATQIAGSGLPLGILPMGTSNDVARALNIPLDLADACAVIGRGVSVEVDAGQALPALTAPRALSVEHEPQAATSERRSALAAQGAYFVHALTLGLNVAFARLATDVARRQRWGSLTYAASALEALSQFQPVPMTLRLMGARVRGPAGDWTDGYDEVQVSCRVLQVAAVNAPVFGGAMNLQLPDAGLRDRLLDFVIIEALEPRRLRETVEGLLDALARLPERWWGTRLPAGEAPGTTPAGANDEVQGFMLPGVRRFQARSAVIETPLDVDVTLDGEIRAHTPVHVRVAPDRIPVLVSDETYLALAHDGAPHENDAGSERNDSTP
jgi:diacylglycerol kinase (ATP)